MNDGNNNIEKEPGYQYDFCPKCGALTREGTCTSCGRQWGKPQNIIGNGANTNPPANGTYPNGMGYMGTGSNTQNHVNSNFNVPGYNGQNYTGPNYNGNPGYGQIQGMPAYMAANQYVPAKKNNSALIAIICVLVGLLLMGGLTFVGIVAYGLSLEEEEQLSENENNTVYEEYDSEEYNEADYSYDYTTIDGFDYYYDYNYFFEDEYASNHENHSYDEFQNEYYITICDYIDLSQAYDVSYQYVTYQSPDENMMAAISYVVLGGNGITNLEEVNAAIKEESLYLANLYIADYVEEGSTDEIIIMVDSYVTYTDENVISIVLDEYISVNGEYQSDLYAINIDLQNGYIIDNTTIVDVNSELVEEFRANAEWQNSDASSMEVLTNQDILEFMESEALIIFYNPCGLEIGINYYTDETNFGWITATFSDYENYMSHF